ncbi:prophage MuSo1, transcriptional regulator, Cro/CI family protein [Fulvimarina pelagi HTCC2506]|uniref:Prophage MuSo1, transcriptional regulator, Cro/CI family protein n=2 Tax=Fulvimarina pelagi TaxID=217511 RepID=Q0FYV8_9HYPH|nr:prophage MuSo1, transcriptional regulator, Cro/CI family protein [Fulvimarina pelagi HTCC2506]
MDALVKISEATGVSMDWLCTGSGAREHLTSLTLSRDEPIMVDEGRVAIVPRIGTRADAGPGALVQIEDDDVSYFGFRSAWLRAQGVEPKAVRLLDIHGDSMLPTFKDGDTALVDTGINRVVDSRIYAIVFAGLLIVKRVILKRDGSLILRSDNRDVYEDEMVPSGEVSDLHVAGRVFWAGGSI